MVREEIVRYEDIEGNEIKVVSGNVGRRGFDADDRGRNFQEYATEVYENGSLVEKFSELEVPEDLVLPITAKLEELADGGADAEEVVMAIRTVCACASETSGYE